MTEIENLFALGTQAMLNQEYQEAAGYYEACIEQNGETWLFCENLATARERSNELREAARCHEKAWKLAADEKEAMTAGTLGAMFFMRHEMFSKAEKMANEMIARWPDEYIGHHLLYMTLMQKGEYERLGAHMEGLSGAFSSDPRYQTDRLGFLRLQGKYLEEFRLIESDPMIREVIPKIAMEEKAQLLLKKNNWTAFEECIREILETYGTVSAAFCTMLMELTKERFLNAGIIANDILEAEKEEKGLLYHMTLYLDIFICWLVCDGKPSKKQYGDMLSCAAICMKWFEEHELFRPELLEGLWMIFPELSAKTAP